MCLLKGQQTATGCGHSECKNYYMFNKQLCIHSLNNAKTSNNMMGNLSNLLQGQNQPYMLQSSMNAYNPNLPQTLNTKRLANVSGIEHENMSALLNKKKVKLEGK